VRGELCYGASHELQAGDADILLQLHGRDSMWQKERLLNIALDRLPADCEYVAWLDCDVVFPSRRWAQDAERLLNRYPLIQLFSRLIHLDPRGGRSTPARGRRTSVTSRWNQGTLPADIFSRPGASGEYRCNSGMAWAGRRDFLARHGLYDAMILGMGDKVCAAAALGLFADAVQGQCMNGQQREHYLQWALPFSREIRGRLGCRNGTLWHLWHGDLADRHYS